MKSQKKQMAKKKTNEFMTWTIKCDPFRVRSHRDSYTDADDDLQSKITTDFR